MERELWSELSVAISDVARSRRANNCFTHDHALIVRVYLWSALHDRPVSWACRPDSWDYRTQPARLPHQCTMSRRLRTEPITDFLVALGKRLIGSMQQAWLLLKIIDAKPLNVAAHSKDPDAKWGRGAVVRTQYSLMSIWELMHRALERCTDGSGLIPRVSCHCL